MLAVAMIKRRNDKTITVTAITRLKKKPTDNLSNFFNELFIEKYSDKSLK